MFSRVAIFEQDLPAPGKESQEKQPSKRVCTCSKLTASDLFGSLLPEPVAGEPVYPRVRITVQEAGNVLQLLRESHPG